jgi:hypothetical protein
MSPLKSPVPMLLALLVAPMAPRGLGAQQRQTRPRSAAIDLDRVDRSMVQRAGPYATTPPEPATGQDPADSLYRAARTALNRGDYGRAAYLFNRLYDQHPRSSYAADSYYWEALARFRSGATGSLNAAFDLLRRQGQLHPKAATIADAENLAARIRAELARRGDATAAAAVEEQARQLAQVGRQSAEQARAASEQVRGAADRVRAIGQGQRRRGRCDDDDERMAALNALLQMDESRALPILQKVLARRDSGSVCLRRKAVFVISQQGGEGVESILLQAIRSDPDAEVREQAVFWLSQVSSERAAAALDSLLRTSDDRAIQEKAIFALSQQDSPRARQALRDFAMKVAAPIPLRENAIFWLGQQEGNGPFLRTIFATVKEAELKEKIIFSIAQNGDRESRRWLLDLAANAGEDMALRKNAIFWAAQSGGDLPELFALYDRAGDRELKEQLIFAYSQRDEAGAVDKLIQIARSDSDRELRKKALFWLTQSGSRDPRVAKLLEEIIDKP